MNNGKQDGTPIPCPQRRCPGHIIKIEAFKAALEWSLGPDGQWRFCTSMPQSHYHLHCSEDHAMMFEDHWVFRRGSTELKALLDASPVAWRGFSSLQVHHLVKLPKA